MKSIEPWNPKWDFAYWYLSPLATKEQRILTNVFTRFIDIFCAFSLTNIHFYRAASTDVLCFDFRSNFCSFCNIFSSGKPIIFVRLFLIIFFFRFPFEKTHKCTFSSFARVSSKKIVLIYSNRKLMESHSIISPFVFSVLGSHIEQTTTKTVDNNEPLFSRGRKIE